MVTLSLSSGPAPWNANFQRFSPRFSALFLSYLPVREIEERRDPDVLLLARLVEPQGRCQDEVTDAAG
jgi:hypothetical protein